MRKKLNTVRPLVLIEYVAKISSFLYLSYITCYLLEYYHCGHPTMKPYTRNFASFLRKIFLFLQCFLKLLELTSNHTLFCWIFSLFNCLCKFLIHSYGRWRWQPYWISPMWMRSLWQSKNYTKHPLNWKYVY